MVEAVDAVGESLLAGRYRLVVRLGSGGTGTVYRAHDLITGETVAVKILNPHTTTASLRHRREVLALRALQIPGVVRLIDEGRSDGRPFLAMEYLPGEPFPGSARRTWAEIAGPTLALLETLARVHAAGIVHRDLKPGNVLVDDTGRPVLLDFGLARGDRLGEAVTRPDSVVGTPRYQAPEQLAGQTVDARTDLYALGLMLYEVLAGRPPHPLDSIGALASARLYRDAPPLQYAAPDAPPDVCRVVDRLLARLPEARPGSAAEVVEALRGLAGASDRPPLAWLGPDTAVRLALDTLHAQRPFVILGAPGSGRTRCLQEIAGALARQGRRAAWTRSGTRPFESVAPIVGQADTLDGEAPPAADPAVIARQLHARLRETLAGGTVVLVDDAEEVDPWSAALLAEAAEDGAVVHAWRAEAGVAAPEGAAITLAPLSEEDLRPLFHGPDRLLHLREDAARALFERTAGSPGRVVGEVAAWVGTGLATWRDGRLALDRTSLDRLDGGVAVQVTSPGGALGGPLKRGLERVLAWVSLAWPHSTPAVLHGVCGGGAWEVDMMLRELERVRAVRRTADGRWEPLVAAVSLQDWDAEERRAAHAALASLLLPGVYGRFAHLVGAEDFGGAAREARLVAARLAADGYVGRAMGVLAQGLEAAREADAVAVEEALLVEAALAAMAENLPGAMKYVRYEIARATPAEPLAHLDRLLAGVVALAEARGAEIADVAASLPPFDALALECWRRTLVQAHAARRGPTEATASLERQMAWAEETGSTLARGRVYGWVGLQHYRAGRMAEAAEWHLRALPLKEGPADRLSTLLNAASALMEAQALDDALALATRAERFAGERRLAFFEARAAWVRRSVEYRLGVAGAPDADLLDAVGFLGVPQVEAMIVATEASVAWRAGHPATADLARRAERLFTRVANVAARVPYDALALLAERDSSPERWRDVANRALDLPPGVAVAQAFGLVALAGVVWEPAWMEAAERSLATTLGENPDVRRAVLADAEVVSYLRSVRSRSC